VSGRAPDASFDAALHVVRFDDATFFAREIFETAYRAPFPVPPADNARTRAWHQYVAFYRWDASRFEPVAFCNWIRHGDVYLSGGLCVRRDVYKRLPPAHYAECKARGGLGQMTMAAAAKELDDLAAWFGHCGDARALDITDNLGYVPTRHPHLIVKWFRELPPWRRDELADEIAAIGPF
jgi:hypothetical protein